MQQNKQLSKNLTVNYSETSGMNDDHSLAKVSFKCTFYGEPMTVNVSKSDIVKGWNSVTGEGDKELFDSFISAMEEDYFEELKELFAKHEAEHNKEYDIS